MGANLALTGRHSLPRRKSYVAFKAPKRLRDTLHDNTGRPFQGSEILGR
ncbi:hypothetical protein WG66_007743 [Moniliophthora roreri]|nr:hypothetical protein WG66_007743 [Moniliophthora roreri]